MKKAVLDYEAQFVTVWVHIKEIETALKFAKNSNLNSPLLTQTVYGEFVTALDKIHWKLARERCKLERDWKLTGEKIVARTTTLVGTIGAVC